MRVSTPPIPKYWRSRLPQPATLGCTQLVVCRSLRRWAARCALLVVCFIAKARRDWTAAITRGPRPLQPAAPLAARSCSQLPAAPAEGPTRLTRPPSLRRRLCLAEGFLTLQRVGRCQLCAVCEVCVCSEGMGCDRPSWRVRGCSVIWCVVQCVIAGAGISHRWGGSWLSDGFSAPH